MAGTEGDGRRYSSRLNLIGGVFRFPKATIRYDLAVLSCGILVGGSHREKIRLQKSVSLRICGVFS
jgi:hypothetical protein